MRAIVISLEIHIFIFIFNSKLSPRNYLKDGISPVEYLSIYLFILISLTVGPLPKHQLKKTNPKYQ